MRIIASVAVEAFSVATAPARADEFDWGPLSSKPRDNQNTIWDAPGQCTITEGSGMLQNVGVNDERNTWTCVWGQTVKATARALCVK